MPPQTHYIRLNATEAQTLCSIRPEWHTFQNHNGVMYLEVLKALYGFAEAGRLWNQLLNRTLIDIGCTVNPYDACIYEYRDGVSHAYISIYVDDFLFMGNNKATIQHITSQLERKFGDLKLSTGKHLNYLNMVIDLHHPNQLILDMSHYKRDLVSGIELKAHRTPGDIHFGDHTDSPLLSPTESTWFHTYVAKLLYLATTTHGEISYYVNFLAQRVHNPTHHDLKKLYRVLGYIKHAMNDVLTLDGSCFQDPKFYVDASYATNLDYKSQTGFCVFFGKGAIMCTSHKQQGNTKSSTEAELIALSDKSSEVIGFKHFFEAFNVRFNSITVYQDNQSTIRMVKNGRSTGSNARHINIRVFWVRDQEHKRILKITYIGTADMVADIATKALAGPAFQRHAGFILGKQSCPWHSASPCSSQRIHQADEGLCSDILQPDPSFIPTQL